MSDILINNIEPGSKVKSVRDYALRYKVNPKTIQRAFDYLDTIDIFYSVVGEGRYLSSDSDVTERIKRELIDAEAELFVSKMKSYKLTIAEVNQIIKENYE